METEGEVEPTTHSYAALLRACSAAGDWRTSIQLLKRMERLGLRCESVHYGLAINSCSRGGEMGKVRSLYVYLYLGHTYIDRQIDRQIMYTHIKYM